jgi:succinyl-CoA synthetase beta subunit
MASVSWVQVSARTAVVLIQIFCGFPRSLRTNTGIITQFGTRPLPNSLCTDHSSFCATSCDTARWPVWVRLHGDNPNRSVLVELLLKVHAPEQEINNLPPVIAEIKKSWNFICTLRVVASHRHKSNVLHSKGIMSG